MIGIVKLERVIGDFQLWSSSNVWEDGSGFETETFGSKRKAVFENRVRNKDYTIPRIKRVKKK